ncbi:hypothetical protein LV469_04135 [Peptoniphilus sp. GNH]|nr:hypothetical protein HMPREF3189_00957 [Clostridiales bacterium KA00134]UHR03484.1 hypothetical protein LV469_04135 [Peptoniphilus sp. GNH]
MKKKGTAIESPLLRRNENSLPTRGRKKELEKAIVTFARIIPKIKLIRYTRKPLRLYFFSKTIFDAKKVNKNPAIKPKVFEKTKLLSSPM